MCYTIEEQGEYEIMNKKYILLTIVLLCGASLIGLFFKMLKWSDTNIILFYLLAVLLTARCTQGYIYGIISSISATFLFNYLFTEPYYTLSVYDSRYLVTFAVMTMTAMITSVSTTRIQQLTEESKNNESQMKILYTLTNHLSDTLNEQSLGQEVIKILSQYFQCSIQLIFFLNQNNLMISGQNDQFQIHTFEDQKYSQKFQHIQSSYLLIDHQCYYPLYGVEKILGVFILPEDIVLQMDEKKKELLISMIENISLALEHIHAIEEQLRLKEVTVKERYRSNLLRAISHDLRTPLTGIMGTSEMIMGISEKKSDYYQLSSEIYNEAKWLYLMVENILSLTKVQEGQLVIHKEYEPIEEVIGSATYRVTKYKEACNIEVHVPDIVLMVPMDARLIEQVLINLLDNALKHDTEKIVIQAYEKANRAYIIIEDYGLGFQSQDLNQMFEMFYTDHHQASVDGKKGVGLGLTICKAIVEAHGGNIRAENCQLHQGGKFIIELPMEEE